MKPLVINHYTGTWQPALCPQRKTPKIGAFVRLHHSPDAREYDDFTRALSHDGKQLGEWVNWLPKLKMDVYKIKKAP